MQDEPALPLVDNGKGTGLPSPFELLRQRLVDGQKRWRALLAAGLLLTGAVATIHAARSPAPSPPPAPEETSRLVAALGRLMPEGDVVTLSPPFGAADARVARVLVAEGEVVEEGQPIVELDSLPQYRAALYVAQAHLAERQAALVQTRAAVAAARDEAQADRDRAASAASLAQQDSAREKRLFAQGVATEASRDRAEAAAVQAARELDRAEAQLARQAGGEAQPDVALAARQLDVARAELARAESDLGRGTILAPFRSRVLNLHVRAGETPDAAGVATLGATDRMAAELEVYQTDIARVAQGQPATLTSPALTAPLTGIVVKIALEVERQTVLAADPAANTDARVVRVTVALDPASAARSAALTGLEVTGRIDTSHVEAGSVP